MTTKQLVVCILCSVPGCFLLLAYVIFPPIIDIIVSIPEPIWNIGFFGTIGVLIIIFVPRILTAKQ